MIPNTTSPTEERICSVSDFQENQKSQLFAALAIMLSALAYVLAMVANIADTTIMGVHPEGFSRASTNIALIVIAVGVWFKK